MDDHLQKLQQPDKKITEKELKEALQFLRRLAHSTGSIRTWLEENGIQIVPCNHYSAIPTLDEIENSFEFKDANPPFWNPSVFNESAMRGILDLA